ncbi:malignant fibrous histiocytoma-amplified sequence 1-like isoform X2 [Ambystoma mexicanum]|uniref:malignant fibrous histiocytoma-amplified sequence 1-like isoform X2 n=1 Tax=Ambystoma mexicanum TaxID=8296 RepID=UPI0037E91E87
MLRQVDLSLASLKVIPSEVLQDLSIESLKLDRNKIRSVVGISKLLNLKTLILSKNELTDFPVEIKILVHLQKLELSQNKVQTIPEGVFHFLPDLEFLKLSNNRIAHLPKDLASCQSLWYLNLSHNWIRTFPAVVLELSNLEEFFVENNKLRRLPAALFVNLPLKKFKATSNRLCEPPEEVCIGGLKQIRSYFQQLQSSEAEEEKRVKTMFLGASMAGKSTLCRSLSQGRVVSVPREDRTVGIEISKFQIQDFMFLFWDFAGQLEYYLTHHVFITPQALVILVINLHRYQMGDMNTFNDLVGFWINNLSMRVPDSVVLPVGTHTDCCMPEEVEAKKRDIESRIAAMLEQRRTTLNHFIRNMDDSQDSELYSDQLERLKEMANYSLHIVDLVPLDCTSYQEVHRLQDLMLELVKDEDMFPNVVKVLPPVYRTVEAAICHVTQSEELGAHGIMELDHLLSEIAQRDNLDKLDKDLLQDILRYLHRIGLIIWYEDIRPLANTVFLKPSFLITMFKMLIRHDLEQQLDHIPINALVREQAFKRDTLKWKIMFQTKAMLRLKAVRVLVKHQLQRLYPGYTADIFEEMVGQRGEDGKLLSLLEHFEICLKVKNAVDLNPAAHEFTPGTKWKATDNSQGNCYLFPIYLQHIQEVAERWAGDHQADLHVRTYCSPEIPEGFFQRLMVKACSFYRTHWVGKLMFLLVSNGRPLLIKENNVMGDSYIEIRGRKPGEKHDFRSAWDFILSIVSIIRKLSDEWPGLHTYLRTPCRTAGCPEEFDWPDMDGTSIVYDMIKEEVKTCETCCNRFATELLLPRESDNVAENAVWPSEGRRPRVIARNGKGQVQPQMGFCF